MQTDYGNENVADILGIRNDVPEEPSTPESKSTPERNKIEIKIPWIAILVAIVLSNILSGVIMIIVSGIFLGQYKDAYKKVLEKYEAYISYDKNGDLGNILKQGHEKRERIGVIIEGTRHLDGRIYLPR